MKFENLLMTFVVIFLTANVAFAQEFLDGAYSFSHKKISYVTLNNGKTIEGKLKDLDRKKGCIEEVTIVPTGKKKKMKLEPADIKYMYLAPSGFDKLSAGLAKMYDATSWGKSSDLDSDKIQKGYVYFEQAEVKIKKKTRTLLMQLVNPSFEGKVRVYFDAMAKQTASLGIGNIKVAGGIAKSYYVLLEDGKPAFKLEKKNYKDEFKNLFGKCAAVKGMNKKWSDFTEATYKHAKECN